MSVLRGGPFLTKLQDVCGLKPWTMCKQQCDSWYSVVCFTLIVCVCVCGSSHRKAWRWPERIMGVCPSGNRWNWRKPKDFSKSLKQRRGPEDVPKTTKMLFRLFYLFTSAQNRVSGQERFPSHLLLVLFISFVKCRQMHVWVNMFTDFV